MSSGSRRKTPCLALLGLIVTWGGSEWGGRARAQGVNLTCGGLRVGEISLPGEVDYVRFAGEAGDLVVISLDEVAGDGFSVRGRVRAADEAPGTGRYFLSWLAFTVERTGEQVVEVSDSRNDDTGQYAIDIEWVLPASKRCADAVVCGLLSPCTFTHSGELHSWSFDAQADDVILLAAREAFDRSSSSGSLYDPTGKKVLSGVSNRAEAVRAPLTGPYTFVTRWTSSPRAGSFPAAARLDIVSPTDPACPRPLRCAGPPLGPLQDTLQPLDHHAYRFEGQAGERISVRVAAFGGIDFRASARLLDSEDGPNGRWLASGFNSRQFVLPGDGEYVLLVYDGPSSYYADPGSYSLDFQRLWPPEVTCAEPLECGAHLARDIAPAGDQDVYTVEAEEGDLLLFAASGDRTSFDVKMDLVDPFGVPVLEGVASGRSGVWRVRDGGTHTLLVSARIVGNAGPYTLDFYRLSPPLPDCIPALECRGTTIGPLQGTLTHPERMHAYRFTAPPGSAVALSVGELSPAAFAPRLDVLDSEGDSIVKGSRHDTLILEHGGSYLVLVHAYDFRPFPGDGRYVLDFETLTPPASVCADPLPCGSLVRRRLGLPGEFHVYQYEAATAGEVIHLTLEDEAADFAAAADLYSPSGSLLESRLEGVEVVTLQEEGPYSLVVHSTNSLWATTGAYTLLAQVQTCCPPLGCGKVRTDSIASAGELHCFSFAAESGDVVAISAASSTGRVAFSPRFEVYDPEGVEVTGEHIGGSTRGGTFRIETSGLHTVTVADSDLKDPGEYAIQLQWLAPSAKRCAEDLACGEIASGRLAFAAEQHLYRFMVPEGFEDDVTVAMTGSGTSFTPQAELFASDGTPVQARLGATTVLPSGTLTPGATYSLLVHEQYYDATGSYRLEVRFAGIVCDCNKNGIADAVDIAEGGSRDIDEDGVPDECQKKLYVLEVEAPEGVAGRPGEDVAFEARARLLLPALEPGAVETGGVSAWSIGIQAEGCSVESATTSGTAGGPIEEGPPGLRYPDGYEKSEVMGDGSGVVAAVVLSFGDCITLSPATSPHDLLALTIAAQVPARAGECASPSLSFTDGLQGSGQPVVNTVTVEDELCHGSSVHPTLFRTSLEVCARSEGLLPGDFNRDERVDISDAVGLLGWLFGSVDRPSLPCASLPSALPFLDFNGDLTLDISDPVALLRWLFLGGPPHAKGTECAAFAGCPGGAC